MLLVNLHAPERLAAALVLALLADAPAVGRGAALVVGALRAWHAAERAVAGSPAALRVSALRPAAA